MHSTKNDLRNALVTQKSKRNPLIYDRIQSSIDETIATLKSAQKNAIVRNLAYCINGQLVLAQLFINRLNGFVPTEEAKFGTTPTAYHIQLRFVHGYETNLGSEPVFISNGSFDWHNLVPRKIGDHITDDVYHEMTVIPGSGLALQSNSRTLSLALAHQAPIEMSTTSEMGKGYETFAANGVKYYFEMQDYNQRHKYNAVYALFYPQPDHNDLLRWHPEYQGYTQSPDGEPSDEHVGARKKAYEDWTQANRAALRNHEVGQQWMANYERSGQEHQFYRLDMLSVNGMYLYADSGLAVDRLYDYQVELVQLFNNLYRQIRRANQANCLPKAPHHSFVDMGVGAGKTYIINTILKSVSRFYQDPNFSPAFCMTPDPALANVMVRVINKQAGVSQIIASAITTSKDIPNEVFLQRYQRYAQTAVQELATIRTYIFARIQNDILAYCRQVGLHPFVIMNELYGDQDQYRLYQNSIDIKRLLLLIEGQKLIIEKTGLSPVIALRRLADELEKIIQGVDKEQANGNPLFSNIDQPIPMLYPAENAQISYDCTVDLPLSLRSVSMDKLNLKDITAQTLKKLLMQKFSYKDNVLQKSVAIRDVLLKIACLSDARAGILLANGGGLANTHTLDQITEQIEFLLEPAALALRRGAEKQEPMSYLEHRTYFLYLNEIFATIPREIDSRTRYGRGNQTCSMSLRHNYQLLQQLKLAIQHQIAQMTPAQEIDYEYGPTMVEAADNMAGKVGLLLAGRLEGDAAKLLATHVPVFTPEGFVSYLEYLARAEGQVQLQVEYQEGIYSIFPSRAVISRQAIQQRLVQIFSAMMVADEIHKEAYQFLYDPTHPLYQRANAISQTYLKQAFGEILPHRIGMSGTVNQIAKNAFGQEMLYSMPLQDMIQRGLTKQLKVTSLTLTSFQQIEQDYFTHHAGWEIGKGILFSKQRLHYFDSTRELAPNQRSLAPMRAIRNQLFVHYLEFVLQKSGGSKELSEIVGIQNTLFDSGISLLDAFQNPQRYDEILQDIIRSIKAISPDLIAETDVKQYVKRSIHDPNLQDQLAELMMQYKNDYRGMSLALSNCQFTLNQFMTRDPQVFEDGLSQVLLGTEDQQTGYSHEFVGAIVDASNWTIPTPIEKIDFHPSTDLRKVYGQLQNLRIHTFSYDEKNQIAGRALRTSSGTASYIEYLSPNYDPQFIFNIETSFSDILLDDKEKAKRLRASVSCNRMVLALLETFEGSFGDFVHVVFSYCHAHHLFEEYRALLAERLPSWWALKCQAKLLSREEADELARMVAEQLPPIEIVKRTHEWRRISDDDDLNGTSERHSSFSAAIWLQWMATSYIPIATGAVLLIAGLSVLGAVSVGLVASNLLLNYGAVGVTVVGAAFLAPALSKTCLAFFQSREENRQGGPGGWTLPRLW